MANNSIIMQRTREASSLPAPRGITPDEHSFPTSSSRRASSKTIPISGSMHRSDSELQLRESEMLAEHRDYCMYMRIVNGMSSSRRNSMNESWNDSWRSDDSLANIIKTRHTPIMTEPFEQLEDRGYPYNIQREKSSSLSSFHHARGMPDNYLVVNDDDQAGQADMVSEEPIFDLEM